MNISQLAKSARIAAGFLLAFAFAGETLKASVVLTTVRSLSNADGPNPIDGLIQGTDGTLYGSGSGGNPDNETSTLPPGAVFKLQPDGTGFTVLHTFGTRGGTTTANSGGASPNGHPVFGSDGALYGVTFEGGTTGYGVFYRLTTDGTSYSLLTSFNASGSTSDPTSAYNNDPEYTYSPVIVASDGNFYGSGGGPGYVNSYLYHINQAGTTVKAITAFQDSTTAYGSVYNPMLEGADHRLYGTAGSYDSSAGYVFAENKDGTGFTILHTFAHPSEDYPYSGLIQGSDGMLYGTADSSVDGTSEIFKIKTDGTGYTVLHTLASSTEGLWASGPLLLASDGRLYGAALQGGANGVGTVFSLATDGTGFAVLHTFTGGTDHGYPNGGMIELSDNSIWGTTSDMDTYYAVYGTGSIFKITGALTSPSPVVSGLSPTSGPAAGGTSVTVTGSNFTGATGVRFGAIGGTSVVVVSATSITVTAPAGSAGTVDVTVTTGSGTSATGAADQFTYVAAPTVTGLSVTSGPTAAGTSVTLTGTNFTGATAVKFGSASATGVTVNSATSITVAAPAGSAGTVDVTVATTGGTSATGAADHYTYVAAPTVTGLSVTSGPLTAGTSVTVTGTNFLNATAVKFGGTSGTGVTINSATSITVTAPAGSAGTVDVTVVTAGGTSATGASDHYTYAAAPTVSGVNPTSGPIGSGTSIAITGTNLLNATAVKFGGNAAVSYTVNSATSITATAPGGSAGTVDVTIITAGGTSATSASDHYTYVAAPTVTGVSVTDGPVGGTSTLIITGTNLTAATTVKFGATNATAFTVNSATSIAATIPSGSAGTVDITVTTAGGTSATGSGDHYTYVAAPTVSGISPTAGPLTSGTSVAITGTNLLNATAVKFGATAAVSYTVNSAASITATAPAGVAGTVDVTVTTDGGTSVTGASDQYTYAGIPTVTGLNVTAGPSGGGTVVTITGTNLAAATAVNFGTTAGSGLTADTATSLSITSPAGTAGTVDVTVTTAGGTSATMTADQFVYVSAPTVTALSVTSGPLAGATAVVITGTDFTNVSAVKFGTANATSFTVNSSTSITATAPAGIAGGVDVTVAAVGGTSGTGAADQFTYVTSPAFTSGATASGIYGTAYSGTSLYQAAATNSPTYSVTTGSLPTGLSLDPITGDLTGTPTQTGSFPVTVTATNAGGSANLGLTVGIGKATTTVSLSNLTPTYDGTPKSATAIPGLIGLTVSVTYNASATPPTTAGTYAVVATIVDANYQGSAGGSLVIGKASTSVSWATPAAISYNTALSGTQLNATANVPGNFVYSPAAATVLAAGSHPLGVTFTPTDTTDYAGSTGSATLQVNQATATVVLSNLTPTYDGTAKSATATTTPNGLTVNFTYGGLSTPPTTAGTYAVVATINDPNYVGTATGSLVIGKAAATVTLGSLAQTYDGTAKSATATTSPTGLTVSYTYNGLATVPTAAGTYAVVATINDTDYQGSNTGNLVIAKAPATVVLTNLNQTYSGTLKSAGATTTPSGLTVTFTYNGSSAMPGLVGTYAVVGTISDANYQGSASGNLAIQQANQSIFFPAPVPTVVGASISLTATASSGLAISYSVSGNATLSGTTVTPLDTNPVSVTASQSGDSNYLAAPSVTRTFTASPAPALLAQTITVGTLPTNVTPPQGFTLSATASSGLPVTYTLTSGPATISGATVTPTGGAGTITIVISQAGNATYAAAPSVTVSVPVILVGRREFFGNFTVTTASSVVGGVHPDATLTGTMAASVNSTNSSATLLGIVGGSAFVVTVTIGSDGSFSGATTAITAPGSTISGPLTFTGTLSGNSLSGTIAELHASFSLPADSTAGVTAFISGFYTGSSLDSSSGSTYTMVGTQGEVLVVAVTSTGISSSMGTVSASGAFTVTTPQSVTVAGSIDSTTTAFTGTVTTPTGGTTSFSGLAATTTRTDRLINLSSRGTVSGANLLVSGMVIGGSANKTVLLRAIGPGLASFGVPGVLAQPHLQLLDATGNVLSDSTAWGGSASLVSAFSLTGAFPLSATSADAAVVMTLAPGQYTIQVSNAGTGPGGVALAEIYDASVNPTNEYQRLLNISTRAFVGASLANLTGGFIVTGNDPKQVLIRGIGPGLTGFGIANALADPFLTVFDSTGAVVAQNDNWSTPLPINTTQTTAAASDIVAADLATGAFTLAAGSKDAALIVTLPPGAYTAQVAGVGGLTGTALVEIYEIPSP